jgi:hypothetical protein
MTTASLRDRHIELLRQHRVVDGLDLGHVPLDGSDRYYTWSQVAAEPVLTRLDRLSGVRRQPDPYSDADLTALQHLLDVQSVEVLGLAEQVGWPMRTSFLAGVFPTGSMNALSRPVPGSGVLVLVDSGLLHLVPDVFKIMIVARPAFGESPLLEPADASSVLAEAFNAYLFGNGAAGVRPLPELSGQRLDLQRLMSRRAIQFVVAHEVAHVIAGHLMMSWRQTDPHTPVGALDTQAVGWPWEYQADWMGARIMLGALDGLSPWERGTVEPYLVGAVLLTLALQEVVAVLASVSRRPVPFAGSHPPPLLRIQSMADHLAEHLGTPESTAVAADLATWLDERIPSVVDWFRLVDAQP